MAKERRTWDNNGISLFEIGLRKMPSMRLQCFKICGVRSNKTEITVCVAVPTYNREQVLVDTVEQVLGQIPKSWRHVSIA